jgi:hypothetical protein
VGKDYAAADKGKTFSKGGNMKRMAFGGETASDKKAKERLANMREENAEVAEGRKKQEREERHASFGRNIAMDDLRAAQKQGKTYDKWFEDNRKDQLKKGHLSKEMYDAGRGIEMMSPSQHREALVSGYKKGGEVKESKAMVGKEVAFFKKKGAPKSMIKHEEAEMKGMKRGGRVRRMAEGGLGSSEGFGDPFAKPRDYEAEKEQGAKSLRGIKNFLGFGDKEEEVKRPEPEKTGYRPRPSFLGSGEKTSVGNDPSKPTIRAELPVRAPGGSKSGEDDTIGGKPEAFNPALEEAKEQAQRAKDAFKPKPSAPRRPKEISVEKEKTKVTASPGYQRSGATAEELERYAAEKKPTETKPKSPSRVGVASDETRESVRRGLGRFADFFNLSKRHEQEFAKKAAKGGQVKRMRYGGSPDDGMDMGQPMRGMAPTPAPRSGGIAGIFGNKSPGAQAAAQKMLDAQRAAPPAPSMSPAMASPQMSRTPYPDPRMKAGGTVKKMAEGGFARAADGIAKKGKTQGKVVKMAGGGFVRSADGCAQRGKTKGAQVKMSRGGKC